MVGAGRPIPFPAAGPADTRMVVLEQTDAGGTLCHEQVWDGRHTE